MCQIFLIKMSLNVKSQGTKVIEFSSQGTNDSKNMRRGPLYVADYEYVNISSLTVLDIKLWLEKMAAYTQINLYIHSNLFNLEAQN